MKIIKDINQIYDDNYINNTSYIDIQKERLRILVLIEIMTNDYNRIAFLNLFNAACEKQNKNKSYQEKEKTYEKSQTKEEDTKQGVAYRDVIKVECRSSQHLKNNAKAFMPR